MQCPYCNLRLESEERILDYSNEGGEHCQDVSHYLTCVMCERTYQQYKGELILI